jgi:hypothetical protein
MLSIVDDRWKLIYLGDENPRLQLFDLATVPDETQDVASEHPAVVLDLARRPRRVTRAYPPARIAAFE